MAHLRAARHARRPDRQERLGGLAQGRRGGLPRRADRSHRQARRRSQGPGQPLLRRQSDLSRPFRAGLEPLLHPRARRAAGRRRRPAARAHRFALQPAPHRAPLSRRRLRRRGDPHAGARHRSRGPDRRRMGGLGCRHAACRARGRAPGGPGQAAAHRGLLQRRRAGDEVRPRCPRQQAARTARSPDPDFADDRHHELRALRRIRRAARAAARLRQGGVARHPARVQPVQVQLLPSQRRPPVIPPDGGAAGPHRAGRASGRPRAPAARSSPSSPSSTSR